MRKRIKIITLHTIGWILVPVGLVGLVMPIIPGVFILILGLLVLTKVSPTMHRLSLAIRKKNKTCDVVFGKIDSLYTKLFGI